MNYASLMHSELQTLALDGLDREAALELASRADTRGTYEEGEEAGYDGGYDDGFDAGRADGHSEGYAEGHEDGRTEERERIAALFAEPLQDYKLAREGSDAFYDAVDRLRAVIEGL